MVYEGLLDLGFKLTEYQLYDTFKTYSFKNDAQEEIEVTFNTVTFKVDYQFNKYQCVENVVIKCLAEIKWEFIQL